MTPEQIVHVPKEIVARVQVQVFKVMTQERIQDRELIIDRNVALPRIAE